MGGARCQRHARDKDFSATAGSEDGGRHLEPWMWVPPEAGEVQVTAPSRDSSEGAQPPCLASALRPEELWGPFVDAGAAAKEREGAHRAVGLSDCC